jgi:hypothetical protein
MAKTAATFRQSDVTRAVRAARAVGLAVLATEIAPDGTIRLVHEADPAKNSPSDPFDQWKASRDARPTQGP